MQTDEDAIRRWAQAHAATVPWSGLGPPISPATPGPVTEPARVVLSSFAEARVIQTGGWTNAVAWAYDPDGRLLLAAGGTDGAVQIWDYGTGDRLQRLPADVEPFYATVSTLAWGRRADGRPQLAVARTRGHTSVWVPDIGEVADVQPPFPYDGSSQSSGSAAWGPQPDGRLLLATAGGVSSSVRIWDPGPGQTVHTLTVSTKQVWAVAWASPPTGQPLLAAAGADGTVELWDPDTGQFLQTLAGHAGTVYAAAWSQQADGRPLLATAGEDGTVRVWAENGGQFTGSALEPHTQTMMNVAWVLIADGRLLLAASSQNALLLGRPLAGVLAHRAACAPNRRLQTPWLDRHPGGRTAAGGGIARRLGSDLGGGPRPARSQPGHPAAPPSRAVPRQAHPVRLVDPPEEVTPRFPAGGRYGEGTDRLAYVTTPDGQILLATTSSSQ